MAGQRFVTRSIITTMPRTLTASVSPSAMAHNLALIRRQVQENRPDGHAQADTRLWAVVKADADGMALLEFEAADWLRRHGWNKPILMLEGAFDATDVAQAAAQGLTLAIHQPRHLQWLAAHDGPPVDVYLKLNTGWGSSPMTWTPT